MFWGLGVGSQAEGALGGPTSEGVHGRPVGDAVRERELLLGAGRGVTHGGVAEGVGPGQVHEHVVVWTDRLTGPSKLCRQHQVSL